MTFAPECVIILQDEASLSLNRTLILEILQILRNPVHPASLANPINPVNLANPAPVLQEEASLSLKRNPNPANLANLGNPAPALQDESSLSLNRTLILQILRNPVHPASLANPINPANLANPVHLVNLANPAPAWT